MWWLYDVRSVTGGKMDPKEAAQVRQRIEDAYRRKSRATRIVLELALNPAKGKVLLEDLEEEVKGPNATPEARTELELVELIGQYQVAQAVAAIHSLREELRIPLH